MAKKPLKRQNEEKDDEVKDPESVGAASPRKVRRIKTVLIMKQDQAEALREHLMSTIPAGEPSDSPLRKVLTAL